MFFKINTRSGEPIYRQIMKNILALIVSGELKENDLLPSVRQSALRLEVNPNTVSKAYQELTRKGVLYSRPGLGYFVNPIEHQSAADMEESLEEWMIEARLKGLSEDDLLGLFKKVMWRISDPTEKRRMQDESK